MLKGKGIITNLQRSFLLSLSTLSDSRHFYLTGGTALAEFYLGHRCSYDLDLFTTQKELILPFSKIVENELKRKFFITPIRRFQTFVEFEFGKVDERIRLQLAYDSPFRFAEPVVSDLSI